MNITKFHKKWSSAKTDASRLNLLNSLITNSGIVVEYGTVGNEMFRITRWDKPPESSDKLSFPPEKFVPDYGRGNLPKEPMLYLSAHCYSPIQELKIEIGETFVLSTWKANDKLRIIDMGRKKRVSFMKSSNVYDFFSDEYSKKVSNPSEYKLTANITHLLLKGNGKAESPFDAIVYPSVKSKFLRENMVIKPDSAKRVFKLKNAVFGYISEFETDKSYGMFVPVQISDSINDKGEITWKKASEKPQRIRIEPGN